MNRADLHPERHSAADVVRLFGLEPLPVEGGWFRRTMEAEARVAGPQGQSRRAWSCIQALFTPMGFSALHRLRVDELWCFQAGDPLELLRLHPGGHGEAAILGIDPAGGQRLQIAVSAGVWQGARVVGPGRWSLVSCLCVPEFRPEDFEIGDRHHLGEGWPEWAETIAALTRV